MKKYLYKKRLLSCRGLSSIPRHQSAEVESTILKQLATVIEPITNISITSLGMVRNLHIDAETRVNFELDTLVPGYPYSTDLVQRCKDAVVAPNATPKDVHISLSQRHIPLSKHANTGLHGVKHVIAVSSCKGGVGKSTVSVNLAYALSRKGLKVGLLDADVYGPSIPLMITPDDRQAKILRSIKTANFVLPLEAEGIKVLSFGHVNPRAGVVGAGGQGAAVMRGPVATRVINQLAAATEWSELDYLIIDFPPGTGDIPLTLCQSLVISGSIIVSTPHPLSVIDVAKGMQMFQDVKVPTLAIVENMSTFTCQHGIEYSPFGPGGKHRMIEYFSKIKETSSHVIPSQKNTQESTDILDVLTQCPYHSFPFYFADPNTRDVDLNESFTDIVKRSLRPVVLSDPESNISKLYSLLADDCVKEIFKLQMSAYLVPSISYIESRGIIIRYFTASKAFEYIINPMELRKRDPRTNQLLPTNNRASIEKFVKPLKFDFKGSYGVAITWSDGHYADIYSFDMLRKLAEELSTAPREL